MEHSGDPTIGKSIMQAAEEVAEGKLDDHSHLSYGRLAVAFRVTRTRLLLTELPNPRTRAWRNWGFKWSLCAKCIHANDCKRSFTISEIVGNASDSFQKNCVSGIQANRERISKLLHESLMLITSSNPKIGYDNAAAVSKKAREEGEHIKYEDVPPILTDYCS
ncbi:hypothetical protein MLD38_002257 [Melastoma candidum]|uniref:Uncharacterized protein n=1 Tax=Melastoma candidum TaxID=119954 RepID=A0ACB9SGU8_9MYRT|nr:hypothetical protein MLD38_002257 [Melastoma candidum]